MFREDDFQYALENTKILYQPQQVIQTFGVTSFRFMLVTELMDYTDRVRIRDGKLHAEKPTIFSPHHYSKVLLEGFGDAARDYADWLESQSLQMQFLRYGFQFRKTDISEEIVLAPKDEVVGRLMEVLAKEADPMATLIEGVDEGWEICLLKFTVDLIQRSAGDNVEEWKRRGFL